ncbi:polyketide synthase dehydratase domain-containing protein, partial [Nocardia sp. NPDC048505]|uniref:polyketide synthase dehydratase domain-containing protein n=1 Tax=Nocardia sp. NPDC048505 TaxID=3155756 RepID=UPI0033D584DA
MAAAWSPPAASRLDVTGAYERLRHRGYDYGPAFRGLTELWRDQADVFAEAAIGEGSAAESGFGLHPALLDSVLHAVLVAVGERTDILLPFAWSGVRLHATGATRVRARIRITGENSVSIWIVDAVGQPVLTVDELVLRATSAERITALSAGGPAGGLYRVQWSAAEAVAVDSGIATRLVTLDGIEEAETVLRSIQEIPDMVTLRCVSDAKGADVVAGTHDMTLRMLRLLRFYLDDDRLAQTPLVVLTRQAVDTGERPVADLSGAALWGLVASAQSEYPGRIVLLDSDTDIEEADIRSVLRRVPLEESQLVLHRGRLLLPRLVAVESESTASPLAELTGSDGVVLVTGGTSGLGALIAQHLAHTHHIPHLVLT